MQVFTLFIGSFSICPILQCGLRLRFCQATGVTAPSAKSDLQWEAHCSLCCRTCLFSGLAVFRCVRCDWILLLVMFCISSCSWRSLLFVQINRLWLRDLGWGERSYVSRSFTGRRPMGIASFLVQKLANQKKERSPPCSTSPNMVAEVPALPEPIKEMKSRRLVRLFLLPSEVCAQSSGCLSQGGCSYSSSWWEKFVCWEEVSQRSWPTTSPAELQAKGQLPKKVVVLQWVCGLGQRVRKHAP